MNNRNKNNSILFLTTLSVYLGLVLVGGTPLVLAQTNQDNERIQVLVGQNLYADSIFNLVKELDKLAKSKKYKWNDEIDVDIEISFFEADNSPQFLGSERKTNKNASGLLDTTTEKIGRDLSKLENIYFNKPDELGSFEVSFLVKDSDLTIKLKHSYGWTKDAQNISTIFRKYFEQEAIVRKNEPLGKIYENTKVTFENYQVFIVTRLPRGSLDALLARKDAQ